ncbi:MAG: DNA translocase FtsK 4TM domain-containing protein [Candidatus Marinimicrobia bacterium]|nr:DNA translocase FtsK 4TM domain-containing protein [Candidatus Neomarinimicrobiota bacterium]
MKSEHNNKRRLNGRQLEVLGLILIILSVLFAMSFASYSPRDELIMNHYSLIDNTMGIAGVFISYFFIKLGVGWFAWGFVPLLFAWGLFTLFRWDKRILKRSTWFGLGSILLLSILFSIGPIAQNGLHAETGFIPGGFVGGTFAYFLSDWLGPVPAIIVTIAAIIILISGFFRFSLTTPFRSLSFREKNTEKPKNRFWRLKKKQKKEKPQENIRKEATEDFFPPKDPVQNEDVIAPSREKAQPRHTEIAEKEKIRPQKKKERKIDERPYQLPFADLLTEAPDNGGYNEDELRQKADKLTRTLAEFGVEGRVTRIIPGPVITMYEVEPGVGVRVNKIVNLEDDIARVMAAKHVRIVAPIPGKTVVGVEIPNRHPELIHYRSIINSRPFTEAKGLLTIAVGKTAEGIPFTFDLDKMPHLLVAGTTGSGKSVCLECHYHVHPFPRHAR